MYNQSGATATAWQDLQVQNRTLVPAALLTCEGGGEGI